jgi:predicted HTH transcriptional regulator
VTDEHRDSDTGRYTPRFTDEEILEFVRQNEPVGTGTVANEFDCSQPSAYTRLSQLEDAGELTSKLIGGNRVWLAP